MFGRCHQVGGVNLKPDFVHFQQKQKNLVQDGTPCCLTRVLIWEDCKHLAVITAHSMWSLWPQWDEEMHVLKVGMSEPEGARANLQHRMLILTADRRMATHVGCVQSAQVSVVFWIKRHLRRPCLKTVCRGTPYSLHTPSLLGMTRGCTQSWLRLWLSPSQSSHLAARVSDALPVFTPTPWHRTQSDIRLRQWVETHHTRTVASARCAPQQVRDMTPKLWWVNQMHT